ncbi:unnamed protein product, partial [Discosporangium mesarthrocarpum]
LKISVLLAFFHGEVVLIRGERASAPLLFLVFLSACVSNTTNVVYFPFAGRYHKNFTSALATGGGLGGVLAGIAGLAQASDCYFAVDSYSASTDYV